MRKTRSTSRVPLQTVTTQNSEKVKKDTGRRWQAAVKQEVAKLGTGFTDLKGKPEKPEVSPIKGKPELIKAVDPRPHHPGHPLDSRNGVRVKRESSTARVQPPGKRVKMEERSEEELSSDSEEELDYDQRRERNMRDNEAFFSSLGIEQAKQDLRLSAQKVPKPAVRRSQPKPKVVLPTRKSLRLQRIDVTGLPLPPQPEPEPFVNEHPRLPAGPVRMVEAMESVEEDHVILTSALSHLADQHCHHAPVSADLARFVSDMKKMKISSKAKVCKDRLFSVALHPTQHRVLAIAGDKWGRLGFWDISAPDQERSVVTYRPHSRPIGHMAVTPHDPLTIYTCSYDSTLRCGHIERGVFDELYSVPEEEDDLFRSFDFLSPTSMLLAQFRGDVALLDTRTPGQKAEKTYAVCDKYLRTVSVHPSNPNFFVTAGTDMKVSMWDLRKLSRKGNKPLHAMPHGRSVSSAYFSPLTGCHILSCSADDTLNVFSCSSSCGEVTRTKSISHNNKTGRWLTPFRAVWHPSRDDVFFVGSMKSPRRMEAFGVAGGLLQEFQGELLSSVCSVLQFHPSHNMLVGGNSSGYIFPFM